MIRLHRLGRSEAAIHLNPDLILMIEAMPDTVLSLTVGTKVIVNETPDEVVAAVHEWRASVLATALPARGRRSSGRPLRTDLTLVRGASTDAAPPHPQERH